MTFFARLLGWVLTWALVLALFAFYVWILGGVFGVRLSDADNATGRDALIAIGTLAASFVTINVIAAPVKRFRRRDQPKREPIRGPSAKELRQEIVPTRADRVRKVTALTIAGMLLLGFAVAVAGAVWKAAR